MSGVSTCQFQGFYLLQGSGWPLRPINYPGAHCSSLSAQGKWFGRKEEIFLVPPLSAFRGLGAGVCRQPGKISVNGVSQPELLLTGNELRVCTCSPSTSFHPRAPLSPKPCLLSACNLQRSGRSCGSSTALGAPVTGRADRRKWQVPSTF